MQQFIQLLIIGLSVGATYALIALGYTMVYGVLRLINFAHGDVYMIGAVVGWLIAQMLVRQAWSSWITVPLILVGAVVGCGLLGFLIEFICYRPLRNRPRLVVLITAIGVSLLLENVVLHFFGPTQQSFPALFQSAAMSFHMAGGVVHVSVLDLLSLGLSCGLMVILSWIVLRTRTGLALRAVSFRFDTAMLMGINTNSIISFTFVLGSSLAAVAGVLDAIRYNVKWDMGIVLGLKAFIAAVLGGIGSIPGALVGGLLIGLIETFLRGVILPSNYTGYSDAAVFVILILMLLVRPSGLLGRNVAEKV